MKGIKTSISSKQHIAVAVFVFIALGDLYGRLLPSETLDYIFKPLLMPSLAVLYFLKSGKSQKGFSQRVYLSLFFSFLGDVFMMFDGKELFFLLGLGSFLVAHVFYVLIYAMPAYRLAEPAPLLKQKPWLALPVVALAVLLYYVLFPSLDTVLKIAVPVYAGTIAAMVLSAINRYGRYGYQSFVKVLLGALMFMVSDSIIALNKFVWPFELAGFCIMLLYITGQYFIIEGLTLQSREE